MKRLALFALGAAVVAYFSTSQTNKLAVTAKIYDFGANLVS